MVMAPHSANLIAISRPKPEPAPVISTTLFSTFFLRPGRIAAHNGPANVFINNIVNRDICVIHKKILYNRNNMVIIDGGVGCCDDNDDDDDDDGIGGPLVVRKELSIICM